MQRIELLLHRQNGHAIDRATSRSPQALALYEPGKFRAFDDDPCRR